MIKVVLDANIFVSAVIKPRSNPGAVLNLIHSDRILLATSPDILAEVDRVLLYPKLQRLHGLSPKEISLFIIDISTDAHVTPGRIKLEVIEKDPTDNKYLECAIEAEADYIISGDRHLTDIEIYEDIRIVDPSTFLQIYSEYKQK